jgi:glycosyltransferase involved in cell wall biosynthesis
VLNKNILHILHSEMGGTADVVFSILQNNKKLFKEEILFTGPNLNKNYVKFLNKKKISFTYIKHYRFLYIYPFIKIFFFLLKGKNNIVFIHNYQIFPVLFFKLFFNIKIIYIDHKAQNLKNFKDYLSIFLMKFYSYKLIFVSKKNFSFYKKKYPLYAKKFLFIANPVDTKFYTNNIKKKKINKKKYFVMGMASRINSLKLHNLILQVFINKKISNLKIICLFAGEGSSIDLLKKFVNKHQLNNKIKFVGNLNKSLLKKWYKKLDLYVHATKGEGMSVNILQALSMGVPVIASNVAGNNEVIQSTKFLGKLFTNNVKDLSNKILYFYYLGNNQYKKYIFTQRSYVETIHDENFIKSKYLNILKNIRFNSY